MAVFVDDLLLLFDHGVVIKTPGFPDGMWCHSNQHIYTHAYTGRRVRLVLIAVCCDHPALCRVCGFADHMTKTYFCTRCKIQHEHLTTEAGVTPDGMSLFYIRVFR